MNQLEKIFKDPGKDWRGAPFWSWNGRLKPERIRYQVREMIKHGMGGGFMHSRDGLETEYLSKEWMEAVRAAVEEGKKTGFKAWIYDEDRWASGFAGGLTCKDNPEYGCMFIHLQRNYEALPNFIEEAKELVSFSVRRMKDGKYTLVPKKAKDAEGYRVIYGFGIKLLRCNDTRYPALMDEEAVRKFIEVGYDCYKKFKPYFGKVIPGVFTDEPNVNWGGDLAPKRLPWCRDFVKQFKLRHGYDIKAKISALFLEMEESPQIRHDYWCTVTELFSEHYARQLGEWCEKNNLMLTGHMFCEGNLFLQMLKGGAVMPNLQYFQMPGIDILMRQQEEVLTVKQAVSVANQFGRRRILSELYGVTGWEFTFSDQKWVGEWQMCLGINYRCQHLNWYTMKGMAKRDYPASYLYHSPWWRYHKPLADYFARISYATSLGKPARDVLIIHPITSAWTLCGNREAPEVTEIDRGLKELMEICLGEHIDFDLGDELIIKKFGKIHNKKFVVNQASYNTVIVPAMANLERKTFKLLKRFKANGGQLLWQAPLPRYIEGMSSEEIIRFVRETSPVTFSVLDHDARKTLRDNVLRSISIRDNTGNEITSVIYQERKLGRGKRLFYLFNRDEHCSFNASIVLPSKGRVERLDLETGEIYPIALERKEPLIFKYEFPPMGSLMFILDISKKPKKMGVLHKKKRETIFSTTGPYRFIRTGSNVLVLDNMRWRERGGKWSEWTNWPDMVSSIIKKYNSLYTGGYQPWMIRQKGLSKRELAYLEIEYYFEIEHLPDREIYLAMEDLQRYTIKLNGKNIDKAIVGYFVDPAIEKILIPKFLKRGKNILRLSFALTNEFLPEDIYLVGEFGVEHRGFAIVKEKEKLEPGDWCTQGYPQYNDAIYYKFSCVAKKKKGVRCEIILERFEGTVANVIVNGKAAGLIMWHPYRVDITDFLKNGKNMFTIEIGGSPRNLFGPRHHYMHYTHGSAPGTFFVNHVKKPQLIPAGLYGEVKLVLTREN